VVDPRNGSESQHENEKWKVFVLLKENKQGLVLQRFEFSIRYVVNNFKPRNEITACMIIIIVGFKLSSRKIIYYTVLDVDEDRFIRQSSTVNMRMEKHSMR
jgi:hypothetical protein